MKVFLAYISHDHGGTMFAGRTEAERERKVANWCREWAGIEDVNLTDDMTDEEVRLAYFDAVDHEYVAYDDDEIEG